MSLTRFLNLYNAPTGVTVSPAGVSCTAAVGSVAVTITTVALVGVAGTGAVGDVTVTAEQTSPPHVVADIAKKAYDAVYAKIPDAIHTGTLDDGVSTYTGRVVFGGETAPSGFPMATAKDKPREAYLEGFSRVAAIGDTITANGVLYHVLSVRDIVEAGGFVVARVLSSSDITWTTGNFERLARTSDGAGGYTQAWSSISGLSAAPVGLIASSIVSGSERFQAQRVEAVSSWQVWGKGLEGIKEADRVTIGGVMYQVHFVNNTEGRGPWTVLDVGKGVAS